MTVRIVNGALSIIATQPAAGYAEERHDTGPDCAEIRFENGNTGVAHSSRVVER